MSKETMKLGLSYNVFDGEELLESSIRVMRPYVEHVVVVYQTTSNFGNPCRPGLERLLEKLIERKFVDELIHYDPVEEAQGLTMEKKQSLVAPDANQEELGGPVSLVGEQFFHELQKRERGRIACQLAGCTHFISMDTDEFYLPEQLLAAKEQVLTHGYDVTACYMRLYFKAPCYEYLPLDNINTVTMICRINDAMPLRLISGRYPVLVDPTRRPCGWSNFHVFDRSVVEMHHYSFVRKDIASKLTNVSNRANYRADVQAFVMQFEAWTPADGVLHPHPAIGRQFKYVTTHPDPFNIHLDLTCSYCLALSITRCSRCHHAVYCSSECQLKDWPQHKLKCLQSSIVSSSEK